MWVEVLKVEMRRSEVDYGAVIGRKVVNVYKDPVLIVELEGECYVHVEGPWRFRKERVIFSGTSDPQAEVTLKEQTVGKRVTDVVHPEEISDLTIVLDGKDRLELLCDSGWYECWGIHGPNGFGVVATPGGGYEWWEAE